jgi:hypothetical protein
MWVVATALAFASGALVTALAFDELFEVAFKAGGPWVAGISLLAGAGAFVVADELLDRYGGSLGFALLAGVTLDGFLRTSPWVSASSEVLSSVFSRSWLASLPPTSPKL